MQSERRWRQAPLLLITAMALVLTACGTSSSGGSSNGRATIKLAIGSPSWNAGYATLAASEAEKYFAKQNLDVKVLLFPSGTQVAQQVVSGQVDVGLMTPEPVGIGHAKNLDLVYFAQYWPQWIYSLETPAGSSVHSVADLAGKRVGVTAVASSGATFARTAMKMQGLDPESLKLVPIGAGAQQVNAIKSGQVDALALWDTQYQIVENAGVDLTPLPVPGTEGLFGGGFAVTKSVLKSKRDVLIRLGRAVAQGLVFAQANPEAAVHDLWKQHPETKTNQPEQSQLAEQVKVLQVRLAGQQLSGGGAQGWGYMAPASVTGTIDFMAKAGLIDKAFPASDIYTNDLIKDINAFSYDDVRSAAKSAA